MNTQTKADKFKVGQTIYAIRREGVYEYIVRERTRRGYVLDRKEYDSLTQADTWETVFVRTQDANRLFSASPEVTQ